MKKLFSYFNRWFNFFAVVFVIFGFIGLLTITAGNAIAAGTSNEALLNKTLIQCLNDQDLLPISSAVAVGNSIIIDTDEFNLGGTHYKANLIVDQYIMTNRDGGALKMPNVALASNTGIDTKAELIIVLKMPNLTKTDQYLLATFKGGGALKRDNLASFCEEGNLNGTELTLA